MLKKILLVEDDLFLIDIYKKKFEKSGFEVKVAETGKKALKIAKELKPDLVLLDIVLPEMAGWEVLKKLKKTNPNLKVVFLTNLSQRSEVDKGLKLGAEKYIIKSQHTPSDVVKQVKKII